MRGRFVTIIYVSTASVAARWKKQYFVKGNWLPQHYMLDPKEIYDRLVALGPNPDASKVEEIIGNELWTRITCDGCQGSVKEVIALGEGSKARHYCFQCIAEANEVRVRLSA